MFNSMVRLTKFACFGTLCALLLPIWALAAPSRVQSELPTSDLRQMIVRYSQGAVGRATIGSIREGRFYPVDSYTMGALGAVDCAHALDRAQAFPLEGMLKEKYIDPETFAALSQSAKYLHPDQVTFFSVLSYLSAEEFVKHRETIAGSQLGQAPPRSRQDPTSVAVTVGSAFLVSGYRQTDKGIEKAPLPWMKDPTFAPFSEKILSEANGVSFEMGRAMQVVPGTLDLNIQAVLMTIAHEAAVHRFDFSTARIFVHSYKRANTINYRRKVPSLKVVAVDPQNPDNVVMATTLQELYSADKPWSYSAPLQLLRAVRPEVISVVKAWNFLTALRSTGAMSLDYINKSGTRGAWPVHMRVSSGLLSIAVSGHTARMGVTLQQDADKIVGILQNEMLFVSDINPANIVDQIAAQATNSFAQDGSTVTLSNLDSRESKADPQYELKVLFSGVLQHNEFMSQAGQSPSPSTHFVLVTSDSEVAEKIKQLGPSDQRGQSLSSQWNLQNHSQGAAFTFTQATARSFIFTYSDLNRLARTHADLVQRMQLDPALRVGKFHREEITSRPTGL